MILRKTAASGAAALAFFLMSTESAYAYLDPGTGSILLQGLIGAIAAGLAFFKFYWHKLKIILGLQPQTEGAELSNVSEADSSTDDKN